jgi:hypothetical protein
MSQNDQNRDQQQQGEGYQDPNEQDALDSRRDSIGSEPLTAETTTPQGESEDEEDLDDLDELDEDRDDDQRGSGPNRRFNIG